VPRPFSWSKKTSYILGVGEVKLWDLLTLNIKMNKLQQIQGGGCKTVNGCPLRCSSILGIEFREHSVLSQSPKLLPFRNRVRIERFSWIYTPQDLALCSQYPPRLDLSLKSHPLQKVESFSLKSVDIRPTMCKTWVHEAQGVTHRAVSQHIFIVHALGLKTPYAPKI